MKTSYVAKSPHTASRELEGEMFVMSSANSTLFTLNEVASLIWKSADGATTLQQIVEKICAEFDVEPFTALADAEQLVAELAAHGLLLVADHPVEPPSLFAGAKP